MSYIIDAIRTPIAKQNGHFKAILPEILAANCISEIVKRNQISETQIQDLILANAFGTGGNMARNASLRALPNNIIACTTIDSQCSGGLRAIEVASALLTQNNFALAGGLESCSLAPTKFYHASDSRYSGLPYVQAEFSANGATLFKAAENVAKLYDISKTDMQAWMYTSQQRANQAKATISKFILKIEDKTTDQLLKPHLSFADWKNLETPDLIDRTTAAREADAAAILLLSTNSENAMAKITHSFTIGSDPDFAPLGLIKVTETLINQFNLDLQKIDIFEVGDSFAVNALAFSKHFNISRDKINVAGGTLVYGHPYGATGCISLIHMLAILKNGQSGLVLVPGAGGQTTAIQILKY